jgi:hypothetical protein
LQSRHLTRCFEIDLKDKLVMVSFGEIHLRRVHMTNETDKQNPGQSKQQTQNPSGSVNPVDKNKNPNQEGMHDPKNPQDISRKDPSRDNPTQRRDDDDMEREKRRAS